jgi:hypothetical protein
MIISAKELIEERWTEKDIWLVDRMLPRNGLAGIVASSDCGKSLLIRQLGLQIVLGKMEFLGLRLYSRRKVVFIISTEDNRIALSMLLKRQVGADGKEYLSELVFFIESESIFEDIAKESAKHLPDVIIVDVWSDTYTENPNNWADIRQHLNRFSRIAEKYDCLVLLVHHTVKNSEKTFADKNKVNGSQAIEAKLRCILELRNGVDADKRELRIIKNNYLSREEKAEGMLLQLDPTTLTFTNTGKKLSIAGSIEAGGTIYDANLWINRMADVRSLGLSYEKARALLVEEYPGEAVPGTTWFKMRLREFNRRSDTS